MSVYLVEGGVPLLGSVRVQGAKNSALPILAAAILAADVCELHNCPRLSDVDASIAILRHLGCQVEQQGDVITVDSRQMDRWEIPHKLMREMRSSVIFLGAILGRCGRASISMPGGCELGPRPIDLHLSALRTLGAEIGEQGGNLDCRLPHKELGPEEREISLAFPSVGATENAMLTAVCCRGRVVITNAAREPEILDLQNFLREMGASVTGAGTSAIVVEGGKPLHGCCHRVIPDRIVAATWMSAVAAAGGEVELTEVDRTPLSSIIALLRESGCRIRASENSITIQRTQPLRAVGPVRTLPYPGFPTDAQPPLMAAMTTAAGTTVFVETIFENRYRHACELTRMGADIRVEGRVAVVCGVDRLQAACVEAGDLRGGAALVVAALGAEGESKISGLHHIDRGYCGMDSELRKLGARIQRLDLKGG